MPYTSQAPPRRKNIAIIGSGIAGLSAAWLLSQRHQVTLYEKDSRLGGHANTVMTHTSVGETEIDTGFIVYNDVTYPNLVALFRHLGVATQPSDMSFGVSLSGGRTEYSSVSGSAFLCGGRNLLSPRFWSMTRDILRFYREAPEALENYPDLSLGEFLLANGYQEAFQEDHLLPQAAAIWSASVADIREYPIRAFVRFFENHGLLKLKDRPDWRTVEGGSRAYVDKLVAAFSASARLGSGVVSVRREGGAVWVRDTGGNAERFDSVVVATHANQALALLEDADVHERALLGAFRYTRNRAVLHTDVALMPKRKSLWASWNYVSDSDDEQCSVSYWMNRLQNLKCREQFFLTLNPKVAPREAAVVYETEYEHPLFDADALAAQERLWSLQGARNTWFCGAHFGAGFHEDGLQSGLAVAEQLGGLRRPWRVAQESGRIRVTAATTEVELAA